MKKIVNKIIVAVIAIFMVGCSDPENVIYDVFDGMEHGAVVRTLNRGSVDFNLFDLNSTWDITVETQDEEKGALLESLMVYVSYTDNKDDGVDNSRSDTVLATIPASAFTTSANGLPSTQIEYTFGEALSALGLSTGQYNGGDFVNFRLELHLTDGRTFSAADGSGSLQGSYFQSPYTYRAGILCIPAVPFPGDYVIDMQDSYGDGWNGAAIRVIIDGVATDYTFTSGSAASFTVTVPPGSTSLVFEFVSGAWDSEVTFQITTPSGATGADLGPSPTAGPFALFLCDE